MIRPAATGLIKKLLQISPKVHHADIRKIVGNRLGHDDCVGQQGAAAGRQRPPDHTNTTTTAPDVWTEPAQLPSDLHTSSQTTVTDTSSDDTLWVESTQSLPNLHVHDISNTDIKCVGRALTTTQRPEYTASNDTGHAVRLH